MSSPGGTSPEEQATSDSETSQNLRRIISSVASPRLGNGTTANAREPGEILLTDSRGARHGGGHADATFGRDDPHDLFADFSLRHGAALARIASVDPYLAIALTATLGAASGSWGLWRAMTCSIALLLWGRISARVAVLAIGASLLMHGWSSRAVNEALQERASLVNVFIGVRRCTGTAEVDGHSRSFGEQTSFTARILEAECDAIPIRNVRARFSTDLRDTRRGHVFSFVADLAPIQLYLNEGTWDRRPALARSGIRLSGSLLDYAEVRSSLQPGKWIDSARSRVRRRIVATFGADVAPMARALMLGETDLSDDENDAFKRSGLSHLLAVSGTHLVLAVVTLVRMLKALLLRSQHLVQRIRVDVITAPVGILLSWLYADFSGASGSALRAAAMLSVLFLCDWLGRPRAAQRSLGLSWCGALVLDPMLARDLSFQLSLAATWGLLAASSLDPSRTKPVMPGIDALRASLYASLATAPLLVVAGADVATLSIISNALAAPFGEILALPACLTHAVLSPFPSLEGVAAWIGTGALRCLRVLAFAVSKIPGSSVAIDAPSNALGLVAIAVGLSPWLWESWKRKLCAALTAAAFLAVNPGKADQADTVDVRMLDVGQGDGLLVSLGNGEWALIDGGGEGRDPSRIADAVLRPAFRHHHITELALLVITHPHTDHMGAVLTMDIPIREIWFPGQGHPGLDRFLERAKHRGARIFSADELCAGGPRVFGAALFHAVGPCPAPVETWSTNDNSLVLSLESRGHRLLLMGDAEHDAEAALLAPERASLVSTAVKVGHHGSKTSSTQAFVDASQAKAVLVSSGSRNTFTHPHPITLQRWKESGAEIFRTDLHGEVRCQFFTEGLLIFPSTSP